MRASRPSLSRKSTLVINSAEALQISATGYDTSTKSSFAATDASTKSSFAATDASTKSSFAATNRQRSSHEKDKDDDEYDDEGDKFGLVAIAAGAPHAKSDAFSLQKRIFKIKKEKEELKRELADAKALIAEQSKNLSSAKDTLLDQTIMTTENLKVYRDHNAANERHLARLEKRIERQEQLVGLMFRRMTSYMLKIRPEEKSLVANVSEGKIILTLHEKAEMTFREFYQRVEYLETRREILQEYMKELDFLWDMNVEEEDKDPRTLMIKLKVHMKNLAEEMKQKEEQRRRLVDDMILMDAHIGELTEQVERSRTCLDDNDALKTSLEKEIISKEEYKEKVQRIQANVLGYTEVVFDQAVASGDNSGALRELAERMLQDAGINEEEQVRILWDVEDRMSRAIAERESSPHLLNDWSETTSVVDESHDVIGEKLKQFIVTMTSENEHEDDLGIIAAGLQLFADTLQHEEHLDEEILEQCLAHFVRSVWHYDSMQRLMIAEKLNQFGQVVDTEGSTKEQMTAEVMLYFAKFVTQSAQGTKGPGEGNDTNAQTKLKENIAGNLIKEDDDEETIVMKFKQFRGAFEQVVKSPKKYTRKSRQSTKSMLTERREEHVESQDVKALKEERRISRMAEQQNILQTVEEHDEIDVDQDKKVHHTEVEKPEKTKEKAEGKMAKNATIQSEDNATSQIIEKPNPDHLDVDDRMRVRMHTQEEVSAPWEGSFTTDHQEKGGGVGPERALASGKKAYRLQRIRQTLADFSGDVSSIVDQLVEKKFAEASTECHPASFGLAFVEQSEQAQVSAKFRSKTSDARKQKTKHLISIMEIIPLEVTDVYGNTTEEHVSVDRDALGNFLKDSSKDAIIPTGIKDFAKQVFVASTDMKKISQKIRRESIKVEEEDQGHELGGAARNQRRATSARKYSMKPKNQPSSSNCQMQEAFRNEGGVTFMKHTPFRPQHTRDTDIRLHPSDFSVIKAFVDHTQFRKCVRILHNADEVREAERLVDIILSISIADKTDSLKAREEFIGVNTQTLSRFLLTSRDDEELPQVVKAFIKDIFLSLMDIMPASLDDSPDAQEPYVKVTNIMFQLVKSFTHNAKFNQSILVLEPGDMRIINKMAKGKLTFTAKATLSGRSASVTAANFRFTEVKTKIKQSPGMILADAKKGEKRVKSAVLPRGVKRFNAIGRKSESRPAVDKLTAVQQLKETTSLLEAEQLSLADEDGNLRILPPRSRAQTPYIGPPKHGLRIVDTYDIDEMTQKLIKKPQPPPRRSQSKPWHQASFTNSNST